MLSVRDCCVGAWFFLSYVQALHPSLPRYDLQLFFLSEERYYVMITLARIRKNKSKNKSRQSWLLQACSRFGLSDSCSVR